ncbi:MAG: hypothetical protein LC744_07845 [Chloroflexi bacterium]|nr:hypothetical protein [Chloroflexota bacterium]
MTDSAIGVTRISAYAVCVEDGRLLLAHIWFARAELAVDRLADLAELALQRIGLD